MDGNAQGQKKSNLNIWNVDEGSLQNIRGFGCFATRLFSPTHISLRSLEIGEKEEEEFKVFLVGFSELI